MKQYQAYYKNGGNYWYKTLEGAINAVIKSGGGSVIQINNNAEYVREIKVTVEEEA